MPSPLPHHRVREPTLLLGWMKHTHTSAKKLARTLGVCARIVTYWAQGQGLPTLVHAFKIDEVTKGKVPPSSWLATSLAKAQWHQRAKNAEPWDED